MEFLLGRQGCGGGWSREVARSTVVRGGGAPRTYFSLGGLSEPLLGTHVRPCEVNSARPLQLWRIA